ncbi:MAG: hypothetical protein HN842_08025 [Gammaproteobacteria bacterium]|nr:hypothetical protein [Gammaproteobacteria bacterium]
MVTVNGEMAEYWFKFLQLSPDYERYCKYRRTDVATAEEYSDPLMLTRMELLYKDFGDLYTTSFDDWFNAPLGKSSAEYFTDRVTMTRGWYLFGHPKDSVSSMPFSAFGDIKKLKRAVTGDKAADKEIRRFNKDEFHFHKSENIRYLKIDTSVHPENLLAQFGLYLETVKEEREKALRKREDFPNYAIRYAYRGNWNQRTAHTFDKIIALHRQQNSGIKISQMTEKHFRALKMFGNLAALRVSAQKLYTEGQNIINGVLDGAFPIRE